MKMLFYTSAPTMNEASIPHLAPLAKPTKWESVANVTVLRVQNASYRNAVFNGVFAVDEVETAKHQNLKDGWSVAIVYCLWFGTRLKTRGIELKYQVDTSELLKNYTGDVVSNLST